MNKKGFMFIETIVTLTVLMALLITFYAVFSNVLQRERVVSEYDKYGDKFALFYYKEKLLKEGTTIAQGKYFASELGLNFETENKNNRCSIIIMPCNYTGDLSNITGGINCVVSKEFKQYRKRVKACGESNEFVIMGEFQTLKDVYSYAHIYYPNR